MTRRHRTTRWLGRNGPWLLAMALAAWGTCALAFWSWPAGEGGVSGFVVWMVYSAVFVVVLPAAGLVLLWVFLIVVLNRCGAWDDHEERT